MLNDPEHQRWKERLTPEQLTYYTRLVAYFRAVLIDGVNDLKDHTFEIEE